MTYIKIGSTLYAAEISGKTPDRDWDNRESKSITLTMNYADAVALFVNDLAWSIVSVHTADDGTETTEEFDNSSFSIAGDITDHRDGTITVKMGKPTELENALEFLLGGGSNV